MEIKEAKIKKLENGKYRVVSNSGGDLGTYATKSEAKKRLSQVEAFKRINEIKDAVGNKARRLDKDPNHYYDRGGIGDNPSFWRKNYDFGERQQRLNKKLASLVESLDSLGIKKESETIKDLLDLF